MFIRFRPFFENRFILTNFIKRYDIIDTLYTMKDFRSRKKENSFLKSRLAFFILVIILIISVRATFSAFQKKAAATDQEQKLSERYQKALDKKQKYIDDLERLESDRGREEKLRTTFDVVAPGETMIKIIE